MTNNIEVIIREKDFSVADEYTALKQADNVGAVSLFVGIARDFEMSLNLQGAEQQEAKQTRRELLALQLEHYPGMAEKSILKICEDAQRQWALSACRVVHRVGKIEANEQIVLVATAAAHRKAALTACTFIMDFLKSRAPLWKKAICSDGEYWINAKASDMSEAEKWRLGEA